MATSILRVRLGDEDLGVFDFQKLTVLETIQLKARTGLTTKAFVDGLAEMDGAAMQGLVWMLRVRKGEVVPDPHALNFAIGDLALEEEPDPTTETSGSDAAGISVS